MPKKKVAQNAGAPLLTGSVVVGPEMTIQDGHANSLNAHAPAFALAAA